MVSKNPGSAMDYIRQIKSFAAFSQLFESRADTVKVDNAVFRLHSQCTVLILMVGTMFVSMRQYFGEPIECMGGKSDINQATLQHYCWLESTFSVSDSSHKTVGVDVAYPGVKTLNTSAGERKIYHKYYQWVYFVLIIQAIMFYVPKYLWKAKESKRLRQLITELKQRHISEQSPYDRERLIQDVTDSLLISNDYFFFFFFCEFLYFVHLIAQIWFVNIFLSGQFLRLGLEWLTYTHEQLDHRYDPLVRIFPRMTKCLFHKYGYSGAIERHDALCFLPLNIVNEKIYVVLWFWFVFLFFITSLCLLQRILLVLFPAFRFRKIKQIAPSTNKRQLSSLVSRVGNWFILHNLASNMKPSHFRDLVDHVVKHQEAMMCMKGVPSKLRDFFPMNEKPGATEHKPASGKKSKGAISSIKNIGFKKNSNPPKAGFVIVNRDPPSGHSADSEEWQMNIGTNNNEELLKEPWP